jgi:hypothetical protein
VVDFHDGRGQFLREMPFLSFQDDSRCMVHCIIARIKKLDLLIWVFDGISGGFTFRGKETALKIQRY